MARDPFKHRFAKRHTAYEKDFSGKYDPTMPISIKDLQTESRIRELAVLTGESISTAVRIAIEQGLRRESARRRSGVAERLLDLSLGGHGSKQFDESAEKAIGYDENGSPRRSSTPPRSSRFSPNASARAGILPL